MPGHGEPPAGTHRRERVALQELYLDVDSPAGECVPGCAPLQLVAGCPRAPEDCPNVQTLEVRASTEAACQKTMWPANKWGKMGRH